MFLRGRNEPSGPYPNSDRIRPNARGREGLIAIGTRARSRRYNGDAAVAEAVVHS
jgi:hypothetical protein